MSINKCILNTMDNIGGIVSASIIFPSDIKYQVAMSGKWRIVLHGNSQWRELVIQKNGISLISTPTVSDAGISYTLTGNIKLLSSEESFATIELWRRRYAILKLEMADGSTRIAGTKNYPLEIKLNNSTANKVTDWNGYELSFSGTQLDMSYKLAE